MRKISYKNYKNFCLLQLGNEHGPAGTGRGDVGKPT
jgi:hypothetical protein